MKSYLMQLAHALRKTGLSMSAALKRAWATVKLKLAMRKQPVSFWYVKENGEQRLAHAYDKAAPAGGVPTEKVVRKVDTLVVNYYDLERMAWRRFRADRLVIE